MKLILPKFSEKKLLFKFLADNEEDLIEMKKSATKHCDYVTMLHDDEEKPVNGIAFKATGWGKPVTKDTEDAIQRTIVGNTYNYMDSHDDVHLNKLFDKSIQERKGKIWHVHDHEFKITSKVGIPTNVYEKYIDWREVGLDRGGQTQALLMDSTIKKILNAQVFDEYKNGEINQHSVAMQYVKIFMCVNDEEYKEAFANWNEYFPLLGNPEKAEKKGFFFAVKEAKVREISCVLEGSNDLTPTREVKDTAKQPPEGTEEQPSQFDIKQLLTIF